MLEKILRAPKLLLIFFCLLLNLVQSVNFKNFKPNSFSNLNVELN